MGDIGRLKTYWQDSMPLRGNAAERSPESVSMVLRNARILQGYSLKEVATAINVRENLLFAIEDGRFSELPPIVYARGFVSAYARFLQLNCSEMVARFTDEVEAVRALPTESPSLDLTSTVDDASERRTPSAALLLAAFVLLGLAYGVWQMVTPDNRTAALSVPPLPERFQNEQVTSIAATPSLPSESLITIHAVGETWLQLSTVQGQRLSSVVLHAGDNYTPPRDTTGLVLSTGNLATIGISVDGLPVRVMASAGRNQYQISLDPTRLRSGTALLD